MPKYPRPDGHHSITPGFAVSNASGVLKFLETAFDGKVIDKFETPDKVLAHAEVKIGDSVVMLGEAGPQMEAMPASLSYYVDDGEAVDKTYKRALAAGATSLMEPKNQFYGYRSASVKDVGGNKWTICAVVEMLTPEEIKQRMDKMMKG